jgi:hypothetical protein
MCCTPEMKIYFYKRENFEDGGRDLPVRGSNRRSTLVFALVIATTIRRVCSNHSISVFQCAVAQLSSPSNAFETEAKRHQINFEFVR